MSILGKYAWVPTSSDEFAERKQTDIEREDRGMTQTPAGDWDLKPLLNQSLSLTSGGTNQWSSGTVNACNIDTFRQCYTYSPWPSVTITSHICICKNAFEQAFKAAAMLIKEGFVTEMSVEKFVELIAKLQKEFE